MEDGFAPMSDQTVPEASDWLLAHHPATGGAIPARLRASTHGLVALELLAAVGAGLADLGAGRADRRVLRRVPEHRIRGRLAHLSAVQQKRQMRGSDMQTALLDAVMPGCETHPV